MTREMRANKALGQHFLRDRAAIARIVESVPEGSRVLEIGPGAGAITHALLARASALTVIEKDDRFAQLWREHAGRCETRLEVVHGDVLEWLPTVHARTRPQWIVGNLPYNISGPVSALLFSLALPGGMVLMYQREVGERILAEPGSRAYGRLSVLARHHYRARRLLRLPPGAFQPPPKVHSLVLHLVPHHRRPECDWDALQRCLRQGFAHRRKTLANNFKGVIESERMRELGIDPRWRPERLDYAQWCRLARLMR